MHQYKCQFAAIMFACVHLRTCYIIYKKYPSVRQRMQSSYMLIGVTLIGNNRSNENSIDPVVLSNEFGKESTCQDLKALLLSIGYQTVRILPISLENYHNVIDSIDKDYPDTYDKVVFNLCDGCETDAYPGLSILAELDRRNIAYTGASPSFYQITTSKPVLKRYLQAENVPTSPFVEITPNTTEAEIDALGGYPLIVKPSISYASISITDKSVVHSASEALEQASKCHGVDQGVFVERFLAGRELTALVTGDQTDVRVYTVAERVFNPSLKAYERILAFDRYWDGYGIDGTKPDQPQTVYWYEIADNDMQHTVKEVAKKAFLAVEGSGYGRVDLRTKSMDSNEPIVLEVNANCGVSFNPAEFSSTVGEILKMSHESIADFANDLIRFALKRQRSKAIYLK